MEAGTVVDVELPPPAGPAGREQHGRRPAVVLQDASFGGRLNTVLVVPFTTNPRAVGFAGSIEIRPDASNGLSRVSVALAHQLRAVDRSRVKATLGHLSSDDLDSIRIAIRQLLGF